MAVHEQYVPQTVFTFSTSNLVISVPWETLSPEHISIITLIDGQLQPIDKKLYDVRGNEIHMNQDMLPEGTAFYVRRKVDLRQPYSSEGVNHVRPRDLERALDRVIMAAQELQSRELFTHIMEDFQSLGYIEKQQGWRLGADGAADISGHFNGEVTITGGTIAREVEIVGSTSHRQSIDGFADVFVGAVDTPTISEFMVDGTGRYISIFVQITRFFAGTRNIHLQISKDDSTWWSLPENPDPEAPDSWRGTAGAHTTIEDTSVFIGPMPMETEVIEGETEPVPTTYYIRARGVRADGETTAWTPGKQAVVRPVSAGEIAVDAITANKIAAGAITAGKIAAGAITATEIDVSDVITAGNIVIGGDGVSKLTNDLNFQNNTQVTTIAESQASSKRNDLAVSLGYASWAEMLAEALAERTIISGGFIRTSLLSADVIQAIIAQVTDRIEITSDGLIGEAADGSRRIVISNDIVHLDVWDGAQWVMVQQVGGVPEAVGQFLPWFYGTGLVDPNVSLADTKFGTLRPDGVLTYPFDGDYQDNEETDPWTKSDTVFAVPGRFGDTALAPEGPMDGHISQDPASTSLDGSWSVGSWVRTMGGSDYEEEAVFKISGMMALAFTAYSLTLFSGACAQPTVVDIPATSDLITTPTGGVIYSVDTDGAGVWVAAGFGGRLFRSTDNGESWGPLIDTPISQDIYTVATDGQGTWVAAGALGHLFRSTDNGATWGPLIDTPTTSDIYFVATDGAGAWVVVGQNGHLFRSTDNGVTWGSLIDTPTSNPIDAVATDGAGVWVAVGDGGHLFRSTDNGATWGSLITTPTSAYLYSIATDGAGTWVAVGVSGHLFRSTDNGATWGPLIDTPTTMAIYAVATDGAGTWVAMGQSGHLFRSTDNGVAWGSLITTPTTASLWGLATDGAGTWVATGWNGHLFRHGGLSNIIDESPDAVVSGTPTLAGTGYGVAVTPDGQYALVAHLSSPYLTVIDTSDWSVVPDTPTLAGTGYGVAVTPDGQYALVAHHISPYFIVIDTSDWSVVPDTPTLVNLVHDVAFTSDGQYAIVGHFGSPRLTVIDTSDWSTVPDTPTLAGTGRNVTVTPDGEYAIVVHSNSPFLTVIRTSDWSVVSDTPTLAGTGYGAAVTPDGQYALVAHANSPYFAAIRIDNVQAIDALGAWTAAKTATDEITITGAFPGYRPIPTSSDLTVTTVSYGVTKNEEEAVFTVKGFATLAFTAYSLTLFGCPWDGDINDLPADDPSEEIPSPDDVVSGTPTLPGEGYDVAVTPDGQHALVAHLSSPYLTVIDTSDWSTVPDTPTLPGEGYGVAVTPDGQYALVAYSDSPYLTVIDTSDWSVVPDTPTLINSGQGVAVTPDGQYALVAHLSSPYLTVIDTSDWSVVPDTPTLAGTAYGVAVTPDGQYALVAHLNSPRLTVIDTSDWSTVPDTPTLAGTAYGVAVTPDGQYALVGHLSSPRLTVIDTSDWSVVSGTPTLVGTGQNVAFTPDGQYAIVTHSGSPFVTVIRTSDWSVVSGTPTLAGIGFGAAVTPDGQYALVAHATSPYFTAIRIDNAQYYAEAIDALGTWTAERTDFSEVTITAAYPGRRPVPTSAELEIDAVRCGSPERAVIELTDAAAEHVIQARLFENSVRALAVNHDSNTYEVAELARSTDTYGLVHLAHNGAGMLRFKSGEPSTNVDISALSLAGAATLRMLVSAAVETRVSEAWLHPTEDLDLQIIEDYRSLVQPWGDVDFRNTLIQARPGRDISYVTTDGGVHQFTGETVHNDAVTFGAAEMPTPAGDAPVFACRAWVNFDGTDVDGSNFCTIRGSGNVDSIVRNATGDYTMTFATEMPDTNYIVVASVESHSSDHRTGRINIMGDGSDAPELMTTTQVRVKSYAENSAGLNKGVVCLAVFR